MKKTIFSLNLLLAFLMSAFLIQGTSTAAVSRRTGVMQGRLQKQVNLQQDRSEHKLAKIIGVIESRIGGHRLPAKALHKLYVMSDADFQLVSTLCDRIDKEGGSAGADIAFFLVTAMIVVS